MKPPGADPVMTPRDHGAGGSVGHHPHAASPSPGRGGHHRRLGTTTRATLPRTWHACPDIPGCPVRGNGRRTDARLAPLGEAKPSQNTRFCASQACRARHQPPARIGDPSLGLDRALATLRDQPCSTAHDQEPRYARLRHAQADDARQYITDVPPSSGNDPCRSGGVVLAVDVAVIDACGPALVVFAQHADRLWAGSRRDRRRAAFGVASALTGVHSPRARPAVTVAAAEDDWGEAELDPGRG